jgi:hypothetical protein
METYMIVMLIVTSSMSIKDRFLEPFLCHVFITKTMGGGPHSVKNFCLNLKEFRGLIT